MKMDRFGNMPLFWINAAIRFDETNLDDTSNEVAIRSGDAEFSMRFEFTGE